MHELKVLFDLLADHSFPSMVIGLSDCSSAIFCGFMGALDLLDRLDVCIDQTAPRSLDPNSQKQAAVGS
eukprot:scaffold53072_cov42-Prasinocladus_malaysianus.AAC.2